MGTTARYQRRQCRKHRLIPVNLVGTTPCFGWNNVEPIAKRPRTDSPEHWRPMPTPRLGCSPYRTRPNVPKPSMQRNHLYPPAPVWGPVGASTWSLRHVFGRSRPPTARRRLAAVGQARITRAQQTLLRGIRAGQKGRPRAGVPCSQDDGLTRGSRRGTERHIEVTFRDEATADGRTVTGVGRVGTRQRHGRRRGAETAGQSASRTATAPKRVTSTFRATPAPCDSRVERYGCGIATGR